MNAEDQDPAVGGALDLDALDGLLVSPGWSPRRPAADHGADRALAGEASDPLHVAPPLVELELPRAFAAEPARSRPSRPAPRVVMTMWDAPVGEGAPPIASVEPAVAPVAPVVAAAPPVAVEPTVGGRWVVLAGLAAGLAALASIAVIAWPDAPESAPSPAPAPPPVGAAPAVAPAPAAVPAAPVAEAPPPTDWVVHFGYNQIAPEAGLRPPAALLSCAGLEVTGYTCDRGTAESNARLGQARADAVTRLLVAAGYPADRVRARSAGAANPAADNQSAQGRRENRRARVRCLVEPTQPSTGPE